MIVLDSFRLSANTNMHTEITNISAYNPGLKIVLSQLGVEGSLTVVHSTREMLQRCIFPYVGLLYKNTCDHPYEQEQLRHAMPSNLIMIWYIYCRVYHVGLR